MPQTFNYRRALRYTLIFLAPLIVFPVLESALQGATFAIWNYQNIDRGVELLLREVDRTEWIDVWAKSTVDFLKHFGRPFNTTQLKTSDWVYKLGFMHPTENVNTEAGLDQLASFDNLVRDIHCHSSGYPKIQWTYVSKEGRPAENSWDAAFAALVKHQEDNPASHGGNLTFVKCQDTPFLCHVWQVKAPSMVRFSVQELDEEWDNAYNQHWIDNGWTYRAPMDHLRPISVQMIELPDSAAGINIPPLIFSSEFDFLLSLTTKEWSHHRIEEYDAFEVLKTRFHEHLNETNEWKLREVVGKGDDWTTDYIAKPLRLEFVGDLFGNIVAPVTQLGVTMALNIYRMYMGHLGLVLGWEPALHTFNFQWSREYEYVLKDGLVRKYLRTHHNKFYGLPEGPVKADQAEEDEEDDLFSGYVM